MSAITVPTSTGAKACDLYPLDAQMVELSLLLPAWQARQLEQEADDRGVTAGQMLRQVLRDFIARLQSTRNEAFRDQWD